MGMVRQKQTSMSCNNLQSLGSGSMPSGAMLGVLPGGMAGQGGAGFNASLAQAISRDVDAEGGSMAEGRASDESDGRGRGGSGDGSPQTRLNRMQQGMRMSLSAARGIASKPMQQN
mmetsp:Transcript_23888/g.60422  ORF Transcript_23888/g.60422 Transcript_23888/m.60422 type:complete len:116 (+) Transcript_23888:656-1003(+)